MPGKIWKFASAFLIFCISAGLLAACATGQRVNANQVVIAFAGTNFQDAKGQVNGQSQLAGVRMAVDEINALGGINGKTILLQTYDDQGDPAAAAAVAEKISQTPALVVLGHSTSEASNAAGTIYNQNTLPAINIVPTSEKLALSYYYYFNAAAAVEKQADFLANYLRKIKKESKINLLFTDDLYSSALAARFGGTYKGLGGSLRAVDVQNQSAEQITALIADWDIDPDRPEPIFIALPPQQAADLLVSMRRSGLSYPVVGGDNLSNPVFTTAIASLSEEKAHPGYFTDGILTTRAVIFDSANAYALRFRNNFQTRYASQEPGDPAVLGYEAASMAVEAIRRAEITGGDLGANRKAVFSQLSAMSAANQPVDGLTGSLSFNWTGNRGNQIRFGTYQNGKIISAMTQFEPIPGSVKPQELASWVKSGRATTVGGDYVYVIHVVYAGVDLLDIREIDTKNSTYLMDFYLWFRYHPNPDDPTFKPEDFVFANQQGDPDKVEISNEQPDQNNPNGIAYVTYRVTGTFKNDFDFRAYPFDYQDLKIRFRNQNADTTSIQYVVDLIGMRDTTPNELFEHLKENGAFNSLHGWVAQSVEASQSTFSTSSTQGNPQRFEQDSLTQYSLFDIDLRVRRSSLEYIIKSLLPLFLTLILAYISFYLPLGHSERFGVGSTALLTTAFFHLNLATTLPEIGYTVLMELFFYVSYLLSVLIIVLETISIGLENRGEKEEDEKTKRAITKKREGLNLIGRIVYPSLLLTAFVLTGLIYRGILPWPPVDRATLRTPANEIAERQSGSALNNPLATATPEAGTVVRLKLSTWRPEDNPQLQTIFNTFHEYALTHYQRDIRIEPSPIMSTNYNTILTTQLMRGEGPDLLYLHPFIANSDMTNYLLVLNQDLSAEIEQNYTPEKRQPWTNIWQGYYGLPYVGVAQGIYYNQEIFSREHLGVPTTWAEFLKTSDALKQAGYIPIANGLNANEDSEMFMSLMVNTVGGSTGRAEFSSGKRCYNDGKIISAFTSVQEILPYLPSTAAILNSKASKQLFMNQQAAMLFGGSWDLKYFEQAGFKWSVFAPPAPQGGPAQVVFQPDIGIAINKASPHSEEALWFLKWLMSKEGIQATVTSLPGFYPLARTDLRNASSPHDTDFLRLAIDHPTDARMIFNEISDHDPKASDIVRQALYEIASGKLQPSEAAARLQQGLAEWYAPAQSCK
jgi:branched-chain amino acid transport system substrate-binding protein